MQFFVYYVVFVFCLMVSVDKELEKNHMKQIISMNEQYFQNKISMKEGSKPNDLKLKIPSSTGGTIYKKDYVKKERANYNNSKSQDHFESSQISIPFTGSTVYRVNYLYID